MLIRLSSIELNNFKNVHFGKFTMPSLLPGRDPEKEADIIGIYGQNGSGKTAVIDMLSALKKLMCGESLPANITDYITKNEQYARITVIFSAKTADMCYSVRYIFRIDRDSEFPITEEHLCVYQKTARDKLGSIEYSKERDYVLYPKNKWAKKGEAAIDAEVKKRLCIHEHKSVFFALSDTLFEENSLLSECMAALKGFAQNSFYVIRSDNYVKDDARIEFVLPKGSTASSCEVLLSEPTVLYEKDYPLFLKMLDGMNTVMSIIIPGFKITVHEFGREVMRDGREGFRFELMTGTKGIAVPIRYESEGIKKLISVINLIIGMYNNYQMLVVIDELDSGVFEFLLGELLSCIEESGRGQLIFTSHNLRPLEMIDADALIFTTTNPYNRYIRITERTKNLRSSYIRHITLGGLNEEIFAPVNTPAIASAFRECRKEADDE